MADNEAPRTATNAPAGDGRWGSPPGAPEADAAPGRTQMVETAPPPSAETPSPGAPARAEAVPSPAGEGTSAPGRGSRLRRFLLPLAAVVAVVVAVVAFNLYQESAYYVSTDNAQVTGQQVPVVSTSAGRVMSVDTTVGAVVRSDDVLVEVAPPSGYTRARVKAPIDGVVVAVPAAPGANVGQGQQLVTLVDPSQLWVEANVDETKISRVRVGQVVEVHLDALSATVPGYVETITPATAATFSLLPQSNNTTSNFTKISQVVPVRVAINLRSNPGLLGSSASVKIHVA